MELSKIPGLLMVAAMWISLVRSVPFLAFTSCFCGIFVLLAGLSEDRLQPMIFVGAFMILTGYWRIKTKLPEDGDD